MLLEQARQEGHDDVFGGDAPFDLRGEARPTVLLHLGTSFNLRRSRCGYDEGAASEVVLVPVRPFGPYGSRTSFRRAGHYRSLSAAGHEDLTHHLLSFQILGWPPKA